MTSHGLRAGQTLTKREVIAIAAIHQALDK